jgi:serine/threonine protein phosphatase PrpC
MRIRVASLSDKGRIRMNNEDDMLACSSVKDARMVGARDPVEVGPDGALFAVADGMGGLAAGEVASMLAIEAIEEMLEADAFVSLPEKGIRGIMDLVFNSAHESMIEREREDPRTHGMGTTLVMGLVRNSMLYVAWMGDSRCYLYRKSSGLECVTRDHSLVQLLVDTGEVTYDEAFSHPKSNIITRSLPGAEGEEPMPDHAARKLETGDRILFCSDGLNGMLRDGEIGEMLAEGRETADCAGRLVYAANAKGGRDNITVVLVDVLDEGYGER